jgi:hypothetical protein
MWRNAVDFSVSFTRALLTRGLVAGGPSISVWSRCEW